MKETWQEFKKFALKGSLLDLAVAVVIGTAFTAVVNSLVKNILMPLLSYVTPAEGGYRAWHIGRVEVGVFLAELVNFLIIALVVFLVVVKVIGGLIRRAAPPPSPAEAVTKECPFCLLTVPVRARKCGHCTADLPPEGPAPLTADVSDAPGGP